MSEQLGHDVLEQRFSTLEKLIGEALASDEWSGIASISKNSGVFVTGIGSSAAHGKYLTSLLQERGYRSCRFVSPLFFTECPQSIQQDDVIIVISQGLTPNVWPALRFCDDRVRTIVLTSLTAEGAKFSSNAARLALYEDLQTRAEIYLFPIENEYTTLIRIVGPVLGFIACLRFAEALVGRKLLDSSQYPESREAILAATRRSIFVDTSFDVSKGVEFIAGDCLSRFADNLSYKFLEGVFIAAPRIWNFLDVAHGPLQQWSFKPEKNRSELIVLATASDNQELLRRCISTLKKTGCKYHLVQSSLSSEWAIIEFEVLFSSVVLSQIVKLGVDQVDWPAKDMDGELYNFGS